MRVYTLEEQRAIVEKVEAELQRTMDALTDFKSELKECLKDGRTSSVWRSSRLAKLKRASMDLSAELPRIRGTKVEDVK